MQIRPLHMAVVGAANIDIGGFPAGAVVMRDSNPGRIRMSAGGVGRNIACNLARLGVQVQLVTALGGDAFAAAVRDDCAAAGVALDLAMRFPEESSSTYLYIADAAGDMQLAVNDMEICTRITPEALFGCLDALYDMDAVVIDANLPEATIAFLAQNMRAPLIADAVSAVKARRLLSALPRLRAIKPNALEASALTGQPVYDRATAGSAAMKLVTMGVQRVFITLGERGVCCADASGARFLPGVPIQMASATGAGDAFTAALAWADACGADLCDCALAGLAAAALTASSPETVDPGMTEAALIRRIEDIRSQISGL
ncbi:MAG: bifunctional hydroxymethylpyrimidine kinase/phosphomethylpyrimidine kinase [Clostridia bacterium]|nr:bifunctional hydroxymethylpyrimidine kinase/phosphomethylpyrimidine kinase [Clostridia bacterium]